MWTLKTQLAGYATKERTALEVMLKTASWKRCGLLNEKHNSEEEI